MAKDNTRGFASFVGKTIRSVDASAINVIRIVFTDGTEQEVWAEDRHHGIEVIKAAPKELYGTQ